MSDAAANPEEGATTPVDPAQPFSRASEVADALEGVLGAEDYPDSQPEESGAEQEAEPQETVEDNSEEPEAVEEEATEEIELEEVEEPQRRTYKVKVDGEDVDVTFDELKAGYSRDSDYRKKTMALAKEKEQIDSLRQRYESQLDQAIPALQSVIQGKWSNYDWVTMAQEDPAQYTADKAEYERDMTAFNQAMAEKQALEKQRQEDQQKEYKEKWDDARKKFRERHKDIVADPEKGKTVVSQMEKTAREIGFAQEEVSSITDDRALEILYKAAMWDQAQARAKKAKAESAKKAVPKVQKAGTPVKEDSQGELQKQLADRVRQTGRTDALADWLSTQEIGSLD